MKFLSSDESFLRQKFPLVENFTRQIFHTGKHFSSKNVDIVSETSKKELFFTHQNERICSGAKVNRVVMSISFGFRHNILIQIRSRTTTCVSNLLNAYRQKDSRISCRFYIQTSKPPLTH